jgi:hypothetical protein
MPRKLLRRCLPESHRIRDHWLLRRLGARLHQPPLWRLNRRSVSGAAGVGLFVAFVPVPFQMVLAALGAMWLRVNLPLAVGLIFVTNPVTMGPVFYFCYKLGAWLLGSPPIPSGPQFEPGLGWFIGKLSAIWQPLLAGSLVTGLVTAVLGYALVQIAWRVYVIGKRRAPRAQPSVPTPLTRPARSPDRNP